MKTNYAWSPWYCGITHLVIDKGGCFGGGSDVATLQQFEDGTCSVWMYNTHDKTLFTNSEANTKWYNDCESAMTATETRFGVTAKRPSMNNRARHGNNCAGIQKNNK